MMYALANLGDDQQEGGYIMRARRPVSEFGQVLPGKVEGPRPRNPLMAAFPFLWPYGRGGIESDQPEHVGFGTHVRWALQYHDRQFHTHNSFPFVAFGVLQKREALRSARLQMKRRDFDTDAIAMASLTIADLQQAEREEANKQPISNPKVRALRKHVFAAGGRVMGLDNSRASYRSEIWGTCLLLRPPSVWMTINPTDLHDPIAQIFCGENIDMDRFLKTAGPGPHKRSCNIAGDPYAAAKFFNFIVHTVLCTLFGINATRERVYSHTGLLGRRLSGYFGVVEAQGRGMLHLHILLWLMNAPNADEMRELLKTEAFRERVVAYIRQNIRSHLDNFSEEDIRAMPREADLAYSQPLDPHSSTWEKDTTDLERRLVRSQQVHTCKKDVCLRLGKKGKWICKHRAPWELSEDDVIDEKGRWKSKRTYGFINGYCPAVSLTLKCNNDIKLLTNGEDTKDAAWYQTAYQTKKQSKTFNMSALLAKTLMYHTQQSAYLDDIRERNRLLVFRCFQTINRENELSGPQVIMYLKGWGDVIRAHNYTPIYWSALATRLLKAHPCLKTKQSR
jgi:hypothetical protein